MDRTHGSRGKGLGRHSPCNAEIRHFHLSVTGNDHVLRLNVPMDNVLLMGSADPLGHLNGNANRLLDLQSSLLRNVCL